MPFARHALTPRLVRCDKTDANVAAMQQNLFMGGCLCGTVRYEVSGTPADPCFCHCRSCRLASGAPMVAWASFERGGFRLTCGALTERRSSAQAWRGFCASCGTALTYRHEAHGAQIDVTLATLDDPAAVAPQMHVWTAQKLPWVQLSDGLPQHAGGTGPGGGG